MQINTKLGLVDIPNEVILAAARDLGASVIPPREPQGHSSAFAGAGGCPASLVRAMLNHFIASQELNAADKRGDGTYLATWDSWLLTLAAVEKEWVAWTQDNKNDVPTLAAGNQDHV